MAVEAQYGNLPFEEAIAFFRGKQNIPTTFWDDMVKEAHDTAFTVAGATAGDMLADLRKSVDAAITDGISLGEFRNRFTGICQQYGWSPKGGEAWRSQLIMNTNIRTAYAAGRYRQMTDPETLAARPYWQYRHGHPITPRPQHLAWDGLILPADDPWWKTHNPPNGFGCKCRVFALSQQDLHRLGKTGPDQTPPTEMVEHVDPVSGKSHWAPVGIDPGWDYTPGASNMADHARQIAEEKAAKREIAPAPASPKNPTMPTVTTREEAKQLGKTIMDDILATPSGTTPNKTIGEVLAASKDNKSFGHLQDDAELFQATLLERLAATRPIATPAKTATSGKGANAIKRASRKFPDDWTKAADALGPLHVKLSETKRSWQYTVERAGPVYLNPFGFFEGKIGDGYILTASNFAAEHEYAHRLQAALPKLDLLFQDEHRSRTAGEPRLNLKELHPNIGYRHDEFTRKDKYFDSYQGSEYTPGVALEVLTMAFHTILGEMDWRNAGMWRNLLLIDPEMAHLAIGLLFGWKP